MSDLSRVICVYGNRCIIVPLFITPRQPFKIKGISLTEIIESHGRALKSFINRECFYYVIVFKASYLKLLAFP